MSEEPKLPDRTRGLHPYAERYPVHDRMPDEGMARDEVLRELREMAEQEDRRYHEGKVSGSIYSGDEKHYAFLTEAFGLFAHANVLQRDMYPSATKFEAEIVAMTSSMLHGDDQTVGMADRFVHHTHPAASQQIQDIVAWIVNA